MSSISTSATEDGPRGAARRLAVVLGLALVTLLLLMWHVLGGDNELISADLISLVKPHYTFIKAQLARGELPLWNPHLITGQPELAGGQWGVLYPVQLLLLSLLEVPTYIKVSVLLHLTLLAATSWLLAVRVLRALVGPTDLAAELAAGLAAMAITLSGFTIGHLEAGHLMLIQALPYVALTAWAGIACIHGQRWGGATLALGLALIVLAGGPQILPMGLCAALVVWVAVLRAGARSNNSSSWRRPALRLLLFTLAGLGLAGAQLIPTLELAGLSSRAHTGVSALAGQLALTKAHLGGLLLPGWIKASQPGLHWEFSGFIGPPVVALALVPLLQPRTRAAALLLWIAVALLLFAGSQTGHGLMGWLPGYDLLRVPARLVLGAVILLALLGAVGLQQAMVSERARRLAALLLAVIGLLALLLAVPAGRSDDQIVLGWTVVAAAALGARRLRPHLRLGVVLAAGLIALALVSTDGFKHRPRHKVQLPPPVAQRLVNLVPQDRVLTYRPYTWNHGMIHGFRNLGGNEPLATRRGGMLWTALSPGKRDVPGVPAPVIWPTTGRMPHDRLWDLFGVRIVHADRHFAPPPSFRLIGAMGRMALYHNPAAYPRAYLAACPLAASSPEEALRVLRAAPARTGAPALAVVEGIEAVSCVPGAVSEAGSVRFIVDDPRQVELELRDVTANGAYLVLGDLNYPGWRAELDGREARLYHANIAGRAVAVPGGTHRVRMTFAPASVRNGLIVTVAAALLVALLCWLPLVWREP